LEEKIMDINAIGNAVASNTQLSPGPTQPAPAPVVTTSGTAGTGNVAPSAITSTPNQSNAVQTPTLAQVKQAVDHINSSLAANGNQQAVQFAVDPTSKRVVVQVIDPETNKVIRQIPSEEIIQMSMAIGQKLGQLINQQA
jgi:flagellar protein FlaG